MDEEYWTTKEGKTIPVSSMSDDHVRNCFLLLLRRSRESQQKTLGELYKEITQLPDMWYHEGYD